MKKTKLMMGNNIESLKKLPDNSIDSVVTDPPYALTPSKNAKGGFMGKLWDSHVPSIEFWKECLRVLKPGGHVLSFGGTRTYHRMVVNLEDAGFEIRDQIMWIYGSGFPKSLNIGKNVDKIQGNGRDVIEKVKDRWTGRGEVYQWSGMDISNEIKDITKGSSPWEGWGTGLKPANEPICLARKPISEKTITENVLKWGTGGINVDGCRIGSDKITVKNTGKNYTRDMGKFSTNSKFEDKISEGRFPANILFDEEAAKVLDGQSGFLKGDSPNRKPRSGSLKSYSINGNFKSYSHDNKRCDSGGASRFFYIAKVSSKERNLGLGFKFIIHTGTVKHLIYKENNKIKWENQDQRTNSHQEGMEVLHQKDIEEFGVQLKEEQKWNIELFGNYIMDQCQKDFKSITLTEINSTTIYQILNSLIQKNIKTFIVDAQLEKMVDIKFVDNVEKKNTKVIITLQKKDGFYQNVNNVELLEVLNLELYTEEIKSNHPTLKPINLMTYLCRLATPKNGIILDPFMGSGSTGIAALLEEFRFVGMEMDSGYFKIAEKRIESYEKYRDLLK